MDIYEWSMKVVSITDILRIVSFDSKYPGHLSAFCYGRRPNKLLKNCLGVLRRGSGRTGAEKGETEKGDKSNY